MHAGTSNFLKAFPIKFAILIATFISLLLVGCSDEAPGAKVPAFKAPDSKAAAKSGAPGGKGPGGPGGRGNKTFAVEGYIAEFHKPSGSFQTMATLEALNRVELSAAANGRLVNLYAKDGASVQKGSLLAKIDDSELKAQLKQAESSLHLAQQKMERTKGLVEKNAATTTDMEAAEASLKSAEASVELIKAQIAKTEVRAPFSGKLGFVNVSVGAWVTTGTSIATLSEVTKLKAKFALPQRYATTLKVGNPITLIDEERAIQKVGKVNALDATISESSRTRQIMVTVDNSKGELIAGGYAKVSVELQSGRIQTIPIPAEALTLDKDGAYIFVVQDGKASMRRVETGLRTPIAVDVISGLNEGDTVITSGLISIRQGSSVRIREIRNNTDYEVD